MSYICYSKEFGNPVWFDYIEYEDLDWNLIRYLIMNENYKYLIIYILNYKYLNFNNSYEMKCSI